MRRGCPSGIVVLKESCLKPQCYRGVVVKHLGPAAFLACEVMKCSYRGGNSSAKNGIAEGNSSALSCCGREGEHPTGTCNGRIAWQYL